MKNEEFSFVGDKYSTVEMKKEKKTSHALNLFLAFFNWFKKSQFED